MSRRDFDLLLSSSQFDASALRVMRVRATERISAPYLVTVDFACPSASPLDLDEVTGAEVTLTVQDVQGRARRFHGLITRLLERPMLDGAWPPYVRGTTKSCCSSRWSTKRTSRSSGMAAGARRATPIGSWPSLLRETTVRRA